MLIAVAPLQALISQTFAKAGCSAAEGERIATYLINANLAGHDSHGVIRVPRYLEMLLTGQLAADAKMEILIDSPVMAVVDGHHGFGQTIGPQAVELGIGKASRNGVAVIALRNSGHLGRIGEWAEMAAAAGQVSIHFVNVGSAPLVAPFGGVERRMSTAPVAIGVPQRGEPPIILDFATSRVAEGKALVALTGGAAIPDDSLIAPDGTVTGDPNILYGTTPPGQPPNPRNGPGALRAMGEHKGSGLSIMCELLAGALTGGGCPGTAPRPFANGMLSIYLAAEAFAAGHDFAGEVAAYVDLIRATKPADPAVPVMMPGDPEITKRAARSRDGIPLSDEVWRSLLAAAARAGLDDAAVARATAA